MARRKKQDEEQENINNINNDSDDTFGLPEVEYEPLKRDEPEATVEPEPFVANDPEPAVIREEYVHEEVRERVIVEDSSDDDVPPFNNDTTDEDEDDAPAVWPKVVVVILLMALFGAGVWYFGFYRPEQIALEQKAKQEAAAKAEADAKLESDRIAREALAAAEQRRADSLASLKPAAGTIEALSDRTGRYYVVIASAIDDDLINDHAKRLSKEGVTSYIIPPFGKTQFSRLAVDFKESYAEAQTTADALKGGDYGNEIWVVRY